MKRIVVTGAKGGTGRSIVAVLRAAGYDVLGLDIQPVGHQDADYAQHDLVDGDGLNDLFAGADGVVHFGSVPTDVWSSRTAAFRNVMMGGYNVLQACANTGVQRLVYASSMEVYGDLAQQPHLPISEESPTAPPGAYGSAKLALESVAADFSRWHGLPVAALRLNRIVYEGSYPWRLQPHTQTDDSAAGVLWGYIDGRDVGTACQAWLEADVEGFRAYNLAAFDVCVETPTRELLGQYYSHMGDVRCEFEAHQCLYDSSAIRGELGWREQYNWRAIRDEGEVE
ncbi:MAG: NAD-dependent epimerase/dehydratase family protein [Candidatus Latescibacteria bacterium]|nr:NAD-dependent epimerase/dehydratase family protein [Candidatus Latescibacterota bacterium]